MMMMGKNRPFINLSIVNYFGLIKICVAQEMLVDFFPLFHLMARHRYKLEQLIAHKQPNKKNEENNFIITYTT